MPSAKLIEKFKTKQRENKDFNLQWEVHCDEYGEGFRDPAKHDDEFISDFIEEYNSGVRYDIGEESWICPDCGIEVWGNKDSCPKCWPRPKKKGDWDCLECGFRGNFANRTSCFKCGADKPARNSKNQARRNRQAAKRKGSEPGLEPAPKVASTTTPSSAVFALAKLCPSFKASWIAYCRQYGQGVSDPGQYDEDFIREFADYAARLIKANMESSQEEPPSQKRTAVTEAAGARPTKLAKTAEDPSSPPVQKKLTIKKAIHDEIHRLNQAGGLLAQIRPGAVAAALGQVSVESGLDILATLESQQVEVEDPNAFIRDEVANLLSITE